MNKLETLIDEHIEVEIEKMPQNIFDQEPFYQTVLNISSFLFNAIQSGEVSAEKLLTYRKYISLTGGNSYIDEWKLDASADNLLNMLKIVTCLCIGIAAKSIHDSNLLLDCTCFAFSLDSKLCLTGDGNILKNHIEYDLSSDFIPAKKVRVERGKTQLVSFITNEILLSLSTYDNWHRYIYKYTSQNGNAHPIYLLNGQLKTYSGSYQSFEDWAEENSTFTL